MQDLRKQARKASATAQQSANLVQASGLFATPFRVGSWGRES
jgi:hypothetical protein